MSYNTGLSPARRMALDHISINSDGTRLLIDVETEFPPGSILIGESRVSSALEVLSFTTYDGSRALGMADGFSPTGSDALPSRYRLDAESSLSLNEVADTILTPPVVINHTAVGDNITIDFEFVPASVGTFSAVFTMTEDPSITIFNETRVVTQAEVDAGQPISFGIGNPYLLAQGSLVTATFTGISLMGGSALGGPFVDQLVPYFVITVMHYNKEQVATIEHLQPRLISASQDVLNGDNLLVDTSSGGVTLRPTAACNWFAMADYKNTWSNTNNVLVVVGVDTGNFGQQASDEKYEFKRVGSSFEVTSAAGEHIDTLEVI